MQRLKAIGFEKLVEVCCTQINRDLCAKFMTCFDPVTNIVTIRGETRVLGPTVVQQFMGLPHGGNKLEVNIGDKDPKFVYLCTVYKGLPYQKIGEWLMEEKDDKFEKFELFFVIFALGTMLTPSASVYVTERVLKCVTFTQHAWGAFDWCSFILTELSEAETGFKRELVKGMVKERKTVGGCLYLLMIFCLENLPLGNLVAGDEAQAITYWNDERVKTRVSLKKESTMGLLHIVRQGGVQAHGHFNPETMLMNPEIKRTYYSIVGMVGAELLALQNRLHVEDTTGDGFAKETGGAGPSGHAHSDSDGAESDSDIAGAGGEELDETKKYGTGDTQEEKKGHDIVRRSQRTKNLSWVVSSPWINPNVKQKGKRGGDDQAMLFDLCTQRPKNDEADEIFVEMYHYHVTRGELYCLRPRGWLNDSVMAMVAKAFVGEQYEKDGIVTRHVFTPHFMSKVVENPSKWSFQENEAQILPTHVGYNIGDCEYLFGPTCFLDHWSCYVLHTQTMRFYALDSLLAEGPNQSRTKKSKTEGWIHPKEHIANITRDCFLEIMQKLKPELFHDGDTFDKEVTWAKVHGQRNMDSCGVHVLSWIQMWDATEGEDGYTMPYYSPDELQQLKSGVLWWLVNSPQNKHREKVLDIVKGFKQRKTDM